MRAIQGIEEYVTLVDLSVWSHRFVIAEGAASSRGFGVPILVSFVLF